MSDAAGAEKTPIIQSSDAESDSNDKCCCCDWFIFKLKPLPRSLRFPICVLRISLILTLASLACNIFAVLMAMTTQDRYFIDLILACIHVPVWMGLDILGNYLVFKAIVEGSKKCFAWFNVEAVFRIIVGVFGILGLPCTGFGGLMAAGDAYDHDYDVAHDCELCAYFWAASTFFVLYGFIHFHIALCCLGGLNSVNAASVVRSLYTSDGNATGINYNKTDVADSAV